MLMLIDACLEWLECREGGALSLQFTRLILTGDLA